MFRVVNVGQWVEITEADFAFNEKTDHQIWHLARAFEHNLRSGIGEDLNEPFFKKFKYLGGMLKLWIDQRINDCCVS